MNEGPPPPKRVCLDKKALEAMTKEDFQQRWAAQDAYIDALLQGQATADGNKQQYEAARRENVLVMRLTTKEQELQECAAQIEELKRVQNPSTTHLRTMTLDPAVNLMFQRMKKEMDVCKEKLEQAQNDLAAWKFTPDGQTGKRLMAKCRMLLQENEELGKVISAGRTAKLEGEIALEKKFVEEMKASQSETDEFLMEMDEDVEGLQTTILVLQQQLKEAKDQITHLEDVNTKLQGHHMAPAVATTGVLPQPAASAYNQSTDCSGQMHVDLSIVKQERDRSNTSTPTGGPQVDSSSSNSNPTTTNNSSISGERTTHSGASGDRRSSGRYGETTSQETPSTTATSNGQHHELMDTVENNSTGQQQQQQQQQSPQDNMMVVTNHHHTHPHSLENTDGKVATAKESPLSPVRTALPPKDNLQGAQQQQQGWTEGKLGQTDEPIQNGLISSQYDSQSDES